jgi:hypothetical protein
VRIRPHEYEHPDLLPDLREARRENERLRAELAKLNTDLVEVASQRDRLQRQVLGDCSDLDSWRQRINAALAPLVSYEDGCLKEKRWSVSVPFDDDDRPPVHLGGDLETDVASVQWEALLEAVKWDGRILSYEVHG